MLVVLGGRAMTGRNRASLLCAGLSAPWRELLVMVAL